MTEHESYLGSCTIGQVDIPSTITHTVFSYVRMYIDIIILRINKCRKQINRINNMSGCSYVSLTNTMTKTSSVNPLLQRGLNENYPVVKQDKPIKSLHINNDWCI